MSKFYIVRDCYAPDTAPNNRMLGFLRAFAERGDKMDVVFFMPNSKKEKAKPHPNIHYHYYWKFLPFKQNWLRLSLYLFFYKYLFALKVRKGDTVLLLGCSNLVPILTSKKGVRVFHERTEHPEVVKLKFTNLKEYYKAIPKLSGLFAISTPIRDFFVKQGIAEEKAHVINMTVDPSRFNKIEKETAPEYIAYCGTASNNKDGVDELIKAFALVHKSHPNIKLYIIGNTPSKVDAAGNLKLIDDLGIKDYVVFTGRISSQQMPQILKNAKVLALDRPKSQQADYGFPTKLGEYLLTGNPVVVTKVGTIPDFLKDGISALLAEERNTEEFASKICWALDNPEEAAVIGQAGADVAITCFNSEKEGNRMYNIMFGNND